MLRTAPWCFARISSTRWSADFRLRVPDSAWLTSSSVASLRVSRVSLPFVALGFIDRPVQPQQAAYRRVGFRSPSYIIVGGQDVTLIIADERFDRWMAALEARHLADLTFPEVSRASRAVLHLRRAPPPARQGRRPRRRRQARGLRALLRPAPLPAGPRDRL